MHPPREVFDLLRRHLLIRRRALAAVCLGLAVWCALDVLTAAPPRGVPVVTAARALESGTTLTAGDLRRTRFSPTSVPATALRDLRAAVGRTLVAPLARGEPLTDGRLLGRGMLAGYPDRSALGLRIPDADAAALLRPGDRVDLVASDPQGDDEGERLVRDAVVLALPEPDRDSPRLGTDAVGRLVLFAVPREDVARVAASGAAHFLTVIWNR